ncbi:M4 family metallopeptidase [Marmoricola sp. URHB0036]|uniref:M4 family metallopeptidase n=1 Tax=Marmoricola sp. URHB0036 TaxID=1298863 RepID=UPI00041F8D67|nr:M4 family metallopeptidase [Marmoricola sp. URHB0036]
MGAVAALALSSLAMAGTVHAATPATVTSGPSGHQTSHRADPSFGPGQRKAAVADAKKGEDTRARQLHLGAKQDLVVKDVQRDVDGVEHVRYERTYAGLPVVGGDLVVHQTGSGAPQTVDWASRADITLGSTTPGVAAGKVRGQDARKVVYAANHKPVLAWESTVTGTAKDGTPIRNLVYTDARNGQQLAVLPQIVTDTGTGSSLYSGTVSLTTTPSGSSWTLTDGARGGHKTYDATGITSESDYRTGTLFTDADDVWGTGTTSSKQSAAVDAHYGAALTWDFYKNTFGRSGIRNNGVAAFSRVHFGNSYENAFWDDSCFCMTYGDGGASLKPVVAIDVAGHEMSHGVTAATDGLGYSGDAGGLNESTSDVMGTMVEFSANNSSDPGDYYIGEKIMKDGTYLRRMDNPSADGGSVNCWSTSTKNLDPHYSSGVGNHLFYLLAEGTGSKTIGGLPHNGTTCNGTTLTGIGRAAAAAEWYRSMTTYWTSTTTYPQAANGMIKAAKDLYGATSAQCTATVAAWKGVSVTPTETCGTTGGGGTGSNLLANPGFESGATSWTSSSGVITNSTSGTPHAGSYYAWLDGYGTTHTDTLSQTVTVPSASKATLSFYLYVDTEESGSTAYDKLTVAVTSGGTTTTRATYSNANASSGYVQKTIDLSAYTGKTITLKLTGTEDSSAATSFLLDDTSLTTG